MKRRKTTPLPSGSGSHAALCHFKIESPTVTMKSNVNYVVLSFGKLCFCYMCTSGDVSPSECCENELRLVSANLVTFLQFLFSDPSSNYFFSKKRVSKNDNNGPHDGNVPFPARCREEGQEDLS